MRQADGGGALSEVHENNFNLIRLLAALQVFYVHAAGHLDLPRLRDILVVGVYLERLVLALPGVPVFFVISGFLVSRSFMNSKGLGDYAWRRALRIFPGLWVHYIVIFIALALAGAWSFAQLQDPGMWRWIGGAFFLGSDWWANIVSGVRPFEWGEFYKRYPSGVLWTINVELGFYLLTPIIFAAIWRKFKVAWLVMALFAAASIWFAFELTAMLDAGVRGNVIGFMRNQPAAFLWVFLLGAALSIHWERVRVLFVNKVLWWFAAYIALMIVDMYTFRGAVKISQLDVLTIPRMIVLAGVVVSFAFSAPSIGKFVRDIDLSYPLYLYHMLVVATFIGFGLTWEWWIWLALTPIVFAISALSWFFVEKPAMRLKHQGFFRIFRLRSRVPSSAQRAP